MKKTLSLLLVFVLMLSILVVPASANGDDIAPCVEVAQCPECRNPTSTATSSTYEEYFTLVRCTYHYGYHQHTKHYSKPEYIVCNNCGYRELSSKGELQYTSCPYSPNENGKV